MRTAFGRLSGAALLLALGAAPSQAQDETANWAPANMAEWRAAVSVALQQAKEYPPESLAASEAGRAVVEFTVDRAGAVSDVRLVSSSGFVVLDAAAKTMVARAAPLPPFTPDMPQQTVRMRLPATFAVGASEPAAQPAP